MNITRRKLLQKTVIGSIIINEFFGPYPIHRLIKRSSLLYIQNPNPYLNPKKAKTIDKKNQHYIQSINQFQQDFKYQQDDLYGLYDIVNPVNETITTMKGDCVDFVNVAASYLLAVTDNPITLVLTANKDDLAHTFVYSDGIIIDINGLETNSIEEYANKRNEKIITKTQIRK